MNIGDAFLMSVPPRFERKHLFFVISDPQAHNGNFIIVNITSDVDRAGKECVLGPQDHDWITHESYVSFADALEITPNQCAIIEALIGTKVIPQKCLSAAALARIVEAAKCSKAIRVAYKKYL
ncbi:MAG TPA: hypothetical protein VMT20_15585 [Terriglobia bacterium]|nr:hypothetical protein [Terriglobia bacterium]